MTGSHTEKITKLVTYFYSPEDIEETMIPMRFGMGVFDVLERTSGAPEVTAHLMVDQIEDFAIYTGLKRALKFQKQLKDMGVGYD